MVDKIANPAAAAGAYANMAKVQLGGVTGEEAQKASFGDLLKNAVVSSIGSMRKGEQMTARAVAGEASLPDVVRAVNAADMTLQTVDAVRDRLITAYQEIMRMPV
ncbi:MAG: flagellar hook-basal body complex protein FliE [Micavibrio sp.]